MKKENITNQDLYDVFVKFVEETKQRFDKIDERFESVDERFESIDKRFRSIDKRFDSQDGILNDIAIEVAKNTGRLDKLTDYAMENRDRIVKIEENMMTKEDKSELLDAMDALQKKDNQHDTELTSHKASYNRIEETQEENTEQIGKNTGDIAELKTAAGMA